MTIKAHTRTLTRWTGSLLSLLIAAAFVASPWCWVVIQVPSNRGPALYLIAQNSDKWRIPDAASFTKKRRRYPPECLACLK